MIIAKIKTFLSDVVLHNGNLVAKILLSGEDSKSDKTITTYSWSTQIITGSGTMSPDTYASSIISVESEHLALTFDYDTIEKVKVTLTVKDEDNKVSIQSGILVTHGSTGTPFVTFHTIDMYPTILPAGNVEFRYSPREVDVTTNNDVYLPGQSSYGIYYIDYVVDGPIVMNDNSIDLNHVFKHKYNEECDFNITRIAAAGLDRTIENNFIQVSFNPVITNAKELIINSVDDCKYLHVYSQTEDYIDKFVGRVDNANMRYLRFHTNVNCCENGGLNYLLAPRYNFDLTYTNCQDTGEEYIDPLTGFTYSTYQFDITVTGINVNYISSISIVTSLDTQVYTYTSSLQLPAVHYIINPSNVNPHIPTTGTITITTIDNFVYTLGFSVAYTGASSCYGMPYITAVEYPALPDGMTYTELTTHTQLELNSVFYQYSLLSSPLLPLFDGIYVIELNDSNISNETISNCIFVNCQTYCLVVKALTNECDIKIKVLYDALVSADLCEQVTCENKCYLYEILRNLLSECDCLIYELEHQLPALDTGCGCSK